jgi:hypothetical protein
MLTKKILIMSLLFIAPIVHAQNTKIESIISQPEYRVLYRNYDNKIIVMSSSGKVINVKAEGANIRSQKIDGENGLIIRPGGTNQCILVATIKDEKGIEHLDTTNFIVRPFPSPIITTNFISKSNGVKINVSMPTDSFMAGIDFEVKAIELLAIKDGAIDGNTIKESFLTSLKVGETIGIIVIAKNNYTGQMMTINGSLEVSD